jgi:type IV pilus assembly protein PilB
VEKQDIIVSFLLDENILDKDAIEKLLCEQDQSGKSFVNMLKTRGLLSKDQLTKLVAATNGIEFVNLSPDMIDPMVVRLVPYDIARKHNLIPVRIEDDGLLVAMSSPMNLSVRDMIATKTGYQVIPVAATDEAVRTVISYHFSVESVTKQDIVKMRMKGSNDDDVAAKKIRSQSSKVADAPIVRLVDSFITGAIDARASDIHIEPQLPDMRVRYRVDGILLDAVEVPASAQREVISHIKILADMDISERRIPQDGHISVDHRGKEYDLRVSSLPATGGEKIVIRVLDASTGLMKLDEITNTPEEHNSLKDLIANPYGMILLTGPTGSGKTTTLYSMIQELNTPEKNIVTVEDPVEYRLKGVTQVQVKPEIGRTFANGLRSILRQDPDIILVGEIRDYETAEIAISAALTGHLVLSTLHTNDTAGAFSRLVSLGIPPFQIASSVLGVVAQRLVRVVCPKCKKSYKPGNDEKKMLFDGQEPDKKVTIYKSKGCGSCRNTGYHGRAATYEIFNLTDDIKNMIIDSSVDNQIKAEAVKHGMKTLRKRAIGQVLDGITTLEELLRVIDMRTE